MIAMRHVHGTLHPHLGITLWMDVDGSVDERWTDRPVAVDRVVTGRGQSLWKQRPSTDRPGTPGRGPGAVPSRTRSLTCADELGPHNPQALLLLLFLLSRRTTTTVTPDVLVDRSGLPVKNHRHGARSVGPMVQALR